MFSLSTLLDNARAAHPEPTWGGLGRRAVYCCRYLLHLPHSHRWQVFLAQDWMHPVARENPSLYRKAIRPYVSLHWPRRTRIAAMIHHYEYLSRNLSAQDFRSIISPAGRELLSLSLRNGDQLTMRLLYDSKDRKEGETTLELVSARYRCRVSSLTFVVAVSEDGAPCMVIGAVTGLPAGAEKDIIKETSKALFGLRPKALLLQVLQLLADIWDVGFLLGVGSGIHPSRHLVYALNRSRLFAITYDDFWQESGGSRRSDGLFTLPPLPPARDLGTVASHKRALYRNRQLLLADVHLRLRVSGLGRGEKSPLDSATVRELVPARLRASQPRDPVFCVPASPSWPPLVS